MTATISSAISARIQQLQQQLARQPKDPGLHYELGRAFLQANQATQAEAALQAALRLAPGHPQILMQLGNCASQQSLETQAVAYFRSSLQQDAQQADVHYNLANSLRKLGQVAAAIEHYRLAIRLQPNDADFYNNLGNAYREQGALALACEAYEQALQRNPQLWHAKVHWIHQKQHMADWAGLEAAIAEVRSALQQDQVTLPPFAFLAMPGTTDAEQTRCASLWAQQHYGHIQPLPALNTATNVVKKSNPRIRLAYLSADFRRHPLAYLVTEVLASHHRHQFEVYLYSQAQVEDSAEQQAYKQAADHWLEIAGMTDAAVAAHMREQKIDILIDLTGYTQHSRCGIVAYKPARRHINWLGYPGSMGYLHGRPLFDAIIVDSSLQLPNLAELPIVLPCYQPNNASRPQAEAGSRADHGLPATGVVFCNFNQSFKITAEMFGLWMQLLQAVPDSVLWLLESNRWAVANLRQAAVNAGIAAERLVFAPRTAHASHIARQMHADLMLDTLPYNAHTTASDALWLGVPILTLIGDTFPARVTASLLQRLQVLELICHSPAAYVEKALALANHRAALQTLRSQILAARDNLFDPQAFCQQLEQAYLELLDTPE